MRKQVEECIDDTWDIDWDKTCEEIQEELKRLGKQRASCDDILTTPMRY